MDVAELVRHWRFRVHRVQLAHYEAGRRFERIHLYLGLPVIILSTIVGTSLFVTLQQSTYTSIKVVVGLLSVTSAVLASLQTFFSHASVAEKHRIAGARSAHLKHQIELLATLPPKEEQALRDALMDIEKQWSTLREDSPNIPDDIWRRIENAISFEEHEKRYPMLAATLENYKLENVAPDEAVSCKG